MMHAGGLIYMDQEHQFGNGGTSKNLVEAYKWHGLARLKGEPRAEAFIEKTSLGLYSDEIAEAKRLVAGWQASPEECALPMPASS